MKVVYVGSESLLAGSDPSPRNVVGNGVQLGKENNSEWED